MKHDVTDLDVSGRVWGPDRLQSLLLRINRSQSALAKAVGVHPVTMHRWVTGKMYPSERMCKRLDRVAARVDELELKGVLK